MAEGGRRFKEEPFVIGSIPVTVRKYGPLPRMDPKEMAEILARAQRRLDRMRSEE